MNATQPIGAYRDSVHEVVLGRAGPYGFVVSLVVVTLGLYGLRGTPRSADVVALILGGAAGVAVAGTLGLRRRALVSSEEALPERWLDFHPLAVALSAAAGIGAGSGSMRDTAAWVVGAAVAGMVYVLVAAGELAFRRSQGERAARRAREAVCAPVALGTGTPVAEWRTARRQSVDALVQLEAGAASAAVPTTASAATVAPPPVEEALPAPGPQPEPAPGPAAEAPPAPGPSVTPAEPPRAAAPPPPPTAGSARSTTTPGASLRTFVIVAGIAVVGLVVIVRLLRR